jgi:hypothetical protein
MAVRFHLLRSHVVVALVALVALVELLCLCPNTAHAQKRPYFVTYSQDMEEPGNLDIETFNAVGNPKGGDVFIGTDVELEYGLKTWWATEFYVDGQATSSYSPPLHSIRD